MSQDKLQEYLDTIMDFLRLDLSDTDALISAIKKYEPSNRVQYDAEKNDFVLGMARWSIEKMITSLTACREAVLRVLDKIVKDGVIGRDELSQLNCVHHDLSIKYVYDPEAPAKLNLNYIIPDSKIAWETGMCPHCGETVTIHLFPDPMPVIGYEAIINTLRLVTRSVKLSGSAKNGYVLAE
jgi:hypothetical protein